MTCRSLSRPCTARGMIMLHEWRRISVLSRGAKGGVSCSQGTHRHHLLPCDCCLPADILQPRLPAELFCGLQEDNSKLVRSSPADNKCGCLAAGLERATLQRHPGRSAAES